MRTCAATEAEIHRGQTGHPYTVEVKTERWICHVCDTKPGDFSEVCAWCGIFMRRGNHKYFDLLPKTHGICAKCADEMMKLPASAAYDERDQT